MGATPENFKTIGKDESLQPLNSMECGNSYPRAHASQSGLWSRPVKSVGAVERLRRGLAGLRDIFEVAREGSGHTRWMRKQIKTRATNRSWYHNRFGAMMTSPPTLVKGDDYTVFTHSRLIR